MIRLNHIFKLMPGGNECHAVRQFNMSSKAGGRVPSAKELAEKLGFSVERKHMPYGISGRLVQDPFAANGYCIEVNERERVFRQRWTVLHEMGHYYLHADKKDPFAPEKMRDRLDPFYLSNELVEEREADEFASALFFDHGALHAADGFSSKDLGKLSRHFGVSVKVIEIALKQF
jgi:hypothetical protein